MDTFSQAGDACVIDWNSRCQDPDVRSDAIGWAPTFCVVMI